VDVADDMMKVVQALVRNNARQENAEPHITVEANAEMTAKKGEPEPAKSSYDRTVI
jgi:hypothetical protein